MAVMHLPVKFGADIFIQYGVRHFFPKLMMAAAAILDLLGKPWDHPWRFILCAYPLLKFCHDRLSSFQVIRIWIFFVIRAWKSYSRPEISVFLGFYRQKFRGTSFRPPKGTSLRGTTHFEPWLVQIWRIVRPVALAKKTKKEKKTKKDSGKLAIRPDHPRRRVEFKVCMPGDLQLVCIVLHGEA